VSAVRMAAGGNDMGDIKPDPEYDFVKPIPKDIWDMHRKRGSQCGECGMKFEYGQAYGFCCQNSRCPMGYNHG
jgi:hypothetical protein